MAGRWARLAISAYAKGYVDFSKTTRNDTYSIFKERLVFDEIERDKVSDLLKTKSIVTAICFPDGGASSQANIGEYMSVDIPWLISKPKGDEKVDSIPDAQKGEAAKLIEMYKKHKEAKDGH